MDPQPPARPAPVHGNPEAGWPKRPQAQVGKELVSGRACFRGRPTPDVFEWHRKRQPEPDGRSHQKDCRRAWGSACCFAGVGPHGCVRIVGFGPTPGGQRYRYGLLALWPPGQHTLRQTGLNKGRCSGGQGANFLPLGTLALLHQIAFPVPPLLPSLYARSRLGASQGPI